MGLAPLLANADHTTRKFGRTSFLMSPRAVTAMSTGRNA
jgi:hypothetical protein